MMGKGEIVDFRNAKSLPRNVAPFPTFPKICQPENELPTPGYSLQREFIRASMENVVVHSLSTLGKVETLSFIEEMRRAAEKA